MCWLLSVLEENNASNFRVKGKIILFLEFENAEILFIHFFYFRNKEKLVISLDEYITLALLYKLLLINIRVIEPLKR